MNDGSREIDAELRSEAAADQATWLVECEFCGLRFVGDYGDLAAHQEQDCDGQAYLDDLFGSDDAEDAA